MRKSSVESMEMGYGGVNTTKGRSFHKYVTDYCSKGDHDDGDDRKKKRRNKEEEELEPICRGEECLASEAHLTI